MRCGDGLSTDVLVGYLDLLVARAKHSDLAELRRAAARLSTDNSRR